MKNKLTGIIIGMLIGVITMGSVIYANPELLFNSVNIEVNGSKVAEKNQNYTLTDGTEVPFSIVYNGTTYLPFRKLGELMNKEIGWDAETETAYCFDTQSNPSGVAFLLSETSHQYKNHLDSLSSLITGYFGSSDNEYKTMMAGYLQEFNDILYDRNSTYNESKEHILKNTTNPDFIKTIEILDQMQIIANDAQKLTTNLCLSYDDEKYRSFFDLMSEISKKELKIQSLLSKYQSLFLNENISNVTIEKNNTTISNTEEIFLTYYIADKYMDTINKINDDSTDYIVAKHYENTTLMNVAKESVASSISSFEDCAKLLKEIKPQLENDADFISILIKTEKLKECAENVALLAPKLMQSYDENTNLKLSNNIQLAIEYYSEIEKELFEKVIL